MGFSYIGNQSAGGLCCFSQCLDVSRMTGSHFDDGYLMFFVQAEQCLGYSNIVIEIALGIKHVELLLEYSGNEFLGCRLAVSACNADDRNIELAAVLTGEVLERL